LEVSRGWDFACHVQRELFGRDLPCVAVPADPSKRRVLESIDRHPERAAWCEVPDGPAVWWRLRTVRICGFLRISACGSRLRRV
jgi:hypothetical protein